MRGERPLVLLGQHAPVELPNGNILMFDNGPARLDHISNAQRLPNGNTLINEGMFGRLFEVTPVGEVVWEYVNPYFGPASRPAQTQTNRVFRVYRYTEEEVAQARRVV